MKYIVILGDGMADEPIEELDGRTPLEVANTPMMDYLADYSEIGLVSNVPEGMKPGSDTANLSVMGYDPKLYYSGRSPLEALSIGCPMEDKDIAIRCNLITISEDSDDISQNLIIDHSSDEISTEEADELIKALQIVLPEEFALYTGFSYRHCLIWHEGELIDDLTPPHDVLTQSVGTYLPKNELLRGMILKSYEILKNHPVNTARKAKGLKPANCCWFWGAGTKPVLDNFEEKFGIKGSVISAVDLLKGIAIAANMNSIDVEGATGGLHTNYEGKADAALRTLLDDGNDFVYVHVEAPDEMGHQGSLKNKILAIEYLDERIIRPIVEGLENSETTFRMLILPDHPTPISLRTHTSKSVPYMLYDSRYHAMDLRWNYNEKDAENSGVYEKDGYKLINKLLEREE